jgi:signal transduction histidine kinase/ActR/RegA family two-component response regulator
MSPLDKPDAMLRLATRVSASRHGFALQLAIGIGVALLAIACRMGLRPALGDLSPWITSLSAVLIAALFGGVVAGLAALILCAIAGQQLFFGPAGSPMSPDAAQWGSLVTFLINGALVGAIAAVFRAASRHLLDVRAESAANAEALHARQRELTEQVADLTALHHFGTQVLSRPEPNQLLRTLLEGAIALQGGQRGFIELYDPEKHRLRSGVAAGLPNELVEELANVPVAEGEGACGTSAARRERVVVEDIEADPLFASHRDAARRAGFRAVWSTPLLTRGGELLGVLSTHFGEVRRPTDREIQLVELYARHATDALETARQCARAEKARKEAEAALTQLREQELRKDEFLAMLAHELRNPLAPLRSVVDIARLRPVPTMTARELGILDRQTAALARIVDDLLDVARITHGKIELQREPIALETLIAHAVESVQSLIDGRRHTLVLDVPSLGVRVDGDPLRLEQVLVNLLVNAAKYTDPGGRVSVRLELLGERARIRVRDTGLGIAPSALESIFDLFQQQSRGLDRAEGGLGVGLTMVRKLVELHGGSVSATSDGLGRGSEFSVELPVLDVQAAAFAPAAQPAPAAARRAHVLVVDDNVDAAELLSELVEHFGYSTSRAFDGGEALRVAADVDPDLVLLDIGLPILDGYEVARRLRSSGSRATLVAISGYGQYSDRERSREAGFVEHWVKPIAMEDVRGLLSRVLAPSAASSSGADVAHAM